MGKTGWPTQQEGDRQKRKGEAMIFRRGKFYWYKFEFRGRRYRATTGVLVGKGVRGEESPKEKAKQVEASKRTELALGNPGITKRPQARRFPGYGRPIGVRHPRVVPV